jgi:hypothetical protein
MEKHRFSYSYYSLEAKGFVAIVEHGSPLLVIVCVCVCRHTHLEAKGFVDTSSSTVTALLRARGLMYSHPLEGKKLWCTVTL